ncbi:HAD family hydrolase [Sediminicola luteus]|uniref:Haloacid dehalogenase n=1 Tax=Sediminicola luteus TaxID=319238 RepID=A0A2A4G6P3_9FLAO|nr:HAD family phosphatase [Sediminicola luteus]PCE63658.1 haloacid dehalogenase [Sediminicola luteus]
MYKNLIFDFGDVFINLDKQATFKALADLGVSSPSMAMWEVSMAYEKGEVTTEDFLQAIQKELPEVSQAEIARAWNAIILDFPEYRLEFIEKLAAQNKHRLFLLSNTNALHIEKVKENMGLDRYQRFQLCFEKFYLSHEIHFRKPDVDIYEFVLKDNEIQASETFFIDDTQVNTDAAAQLGIGVWHLQVGVEDVIDLNQRI